MLTLQGKRTNETPSGISLALSLSGLTDGRHYVIGDQVKGTLNITTDRERINPNLTLHLSYVLSSEMKHSKTKANILHLEKKEKLQQGIATSYEIAIPFHFGRTNFRGHKLHSYWELTVELDHHLPKKQRSIVDQLLANSTQQYTYSFKIPVQYGKGIYSTETKELSIPFFNNLVIGGITFATAVFMLLLTLPRFGLEKSFYFYLAMGILALLTIISYHLIRLASFKMTPMEIKPLRDGKIRIQYLNRGKGHWDDAEVGLRLKEKRLAKNADGKLDLGEGLLFEKKTSLAKSSRPLGHLNELILPWPDQIDEFPTSYKLGTPKYPHGYEWEVFLTTPIPFFGGNKEISWPINVTWERMRTTPPSPHQLEEEKLELRELADNRLKG